MSIISIADAFIQLVPGLARWFTNSDKDVQNAEKVARQIIDVAKTITGTNTAASALSALKQDPKAMLKFHRTILTLERDLEQSYLYDKQSARHRDIAITKAGKVNRRADIMVVAAALGLLSCLVTLTLFTGKLPGEAVGIISTIAGIFGSCLKDAYSFEFGSSRGSKVKDLATFLQNS